jgi:hypothetical protein
MLDHVAFDRASFVVVSVCGGLAWGAPGAATDASEVRPRPTLVARPVDIDSLPPDSPDGPLVVGDGWGCVHVLGWRQPHWQCWRAEPASAGPIRATLVQWLVGADAHFGADRVCARDRRRGKCWPWPDAAWTRPEGYPESAPEGNRAVAVLVGGTFACTTRDAAHASSRDVASDYSISCEGDDTFEQLARHGQPEMTRPWRVSLGTWHGCISGGAAPHCWGRGDGGQLGFLPDQNCQVAGRQIPCSRDMREARLPFGVETGAIDQLFAGDMFTCAATQEWHAFACWGASRDGWLGSETCPPALRKAWPIPGGSVAAPKATCSARPVGIPAFDDVLPKPVRKLGRRDAVLPIGRVGGSWGPPRGNFSVGTRGACMLIGGQLRCVGAIASPKVAFSSVVVNPGLQASACGIADGRVLCWGEGYSPAAAPGTPVAIALERTPPDITAFVDFPPPAGSSWSPLHLANRGCDRVPQALPKCGPEVTGEPWSSLAERASVHVGKAVHVKARLVVAADADSVTGRALGLRKGDWRCGDRKWHNPLVQGDFDMLGSPYADADGCYPESRAIVLADGDVLLDFAPDSTAMDCVGDESRLCCGVQAFGQPVVAEGTLIGSDERGWSLRAASVCEVPATGENP